MYCQSVALFGTKVSYIEQNWLIGTFNKFLGIEITDIESKMLAFSLYAKVKLLKTKQELSDDDVFISLVRFLQAYNTDFQLHQIGKDLKKCYRLFEKVEKLEKEKKNLDVGSLEYDKNGILVGITNNAGNTEAAKFFDFEMNEILTKWAQTTDNENDIF